MAFSGKIDGRKRLNSKIKQVTREVERRQVEAVRDAVFAVHGEAVESIQNNSGGDRQVRYGPKRNVRVSKPGQPPNTDTGRLAKSIEFEFSDSGLSGKVGTNLKYGAALEFGTRKMAPRPWLSRAVRVKAKEIGRIFRTQFLKSIRKVGS